MKALYVTCVVIICSIVPSEQIIKYSREITLDVIIQKYVTNMIIDIVIPNCYFVQFYFTNKNNYY